MDIAATMTDQRGVSAASAQVSGNKKKTTPDSNKTTQENAPASTKQVNNTPRSPTKPSSFVNASLPNATPKLWGYRPKPVARSLSARMPRTDRQERLPRTNVSTTYRDDYKSPGDISYKLHSLNLETSFRILPDTSTTYRESYQWPRWKKFDAVLYPAYEYKGKDLGSGNVGKRSETGSATFKSKPSFSGKCKVSEGSQSLQADLVGLNHSSRESGHARRPQFISKDPFWAVRTDDLCRSNFPVSRTPPTPSNADSVFQTTNIMK